MGWDIWPDNYSRLLDQIEPDETSIPLWRVGGPITATSPIYARFARGFEHASGKDALYFKLRDGFSQDARPKVMSITVVWYDGQAGSTWKLDYDAGGKTMKTALTVTGKGDKHWHHEAVTLRDAVFRQGGIKGADLALVNTDDKDDIFSLIEVHRGEPDVSRATSSERGAGLCGLCERQQVRRRRHGREVRQERKREEEQDGCRREKGMTGVEKKKGGKKKAETGRRGLA